MKDKKTASVVAAVLLLTLSAGSVLALRKVESLRGQESTLEEVLYLPSGKALKRISLGYSSLLATIYWTRAVQYFGAKHLQHATRYDLLNPLLEITTDLDPHLIPAYQTGSIFLSQRLPEGAGQPDKAVALLEKGIRENPEYWRIYFTLGFVHYMDRKDYESAEEAFRRGSEVPGALPWMRVMAARMAEHADDTTTAMTLWRGVYQMTQDHTLKDTAIEHILSLEAAAQIHQLEKLVEIYRARTGSLPARWSELNRIGLLGEIPVDPNGSPYKLMADGTVEVQNPKDFPFLDEDLSKK